LTGDLEGAGLDRVLALPPRKIDVLMAPHHGSRKANSPALARWADPRFVVSCQGPPRSATASAGAYDESRHVFHGTWPHGAVTIRHDGGESRVETFRTRKSWSFRAGAE